MAMGIGRGGFNAVDSAVMVADATRRRMARTVLRRTEGSLYVFGRKIFAKALFLPDWDIADQLSRFSPGVAEPCDFIGVLAKASEVELLTLLASNNGITAHRLSDIEARGTSP